ncbi:MAG: dihydroorotase [Alphaproteobacteria bacterium]|nr:dihydroorotase [Alphaproteobacteria bacterium]
MSTPPLLFRDARLVDPASGLDARGALLVREGRIADLLPGEARPAAPDGAIEVDCAGLVLAPGLIDMRVFTGEPGAAHKETLASAARAAAAGGITTIVVMPRTDPVIDEAPLVDFVLRRARDTAIVNVLPMGALTKGLEGETMAEIGLMQEAGAVAFTDADRSVADSAVMRRALSYARTFDALICHHAEDPGLARLGVMNEGELSTRLGLFGIPHAAETITLQRDLALVELTGARYHLAQMSSRASLPVLEAARARGLPVSAAVSAAHLALNENDIAGYRTFFKTSPPLREEDDRAALADALARGTIDVVVSCHDPQAPEDKRVPFSEAATGAVGLETLLPVLLGLVLEGTLSLSRALETVTAAPARLLGLEAGRLARGAPADLVLIDPECPYTLTAAELQSRSRNTPFDGRRFQGRAMRTFVAGREVFERG